MTSSCHLATRLHSRLKLSDFLPRSVQYQTRSGCPTIIAMPSTSSRLFQHALTTACLVSVITALSLGIFAHKRSLIPLYGSGPTVYLLNEIVFTTVIASSIHNINISIKRNLLYTAIVFTLAPNATYWIGVWTSRQKKPILGPAVTHAIALGPLVFLLTTFIVQLRNYGVSPVSLNPQRIG